MLPHLVSTFLLSLFSAPLQVDDSLNTLPVCRRPLERQEWRTLKVDQRHHFIEAIQCFQRLPATGQFKGVKSRFDDFQALHIALRSEVHLVGQFLPWHRRFLGVFERSLYQECSYEGALPYWDWTLDIGLNKSIPDSPLFDSISGFGTLPQDGGCVLDGPFASYNLSLGPGKMINTHCLTRSYNHSSVQFLTPEQVENTTKQVTFEHFRVELEGRPVTQTPKIHDAGHLVVGGEMADNDSSPGDPLFYLHHSNLDRIWWNWQMADAPRRLHEISGRSSVDPPYTNITLNFLLKMSTLATTLPIHDVMDITREPLCYSYT